jgi:DNA-binding LytR/AlgR family response regulator
MRRQAGDEKKSTMTSGGASGTNGSWRKASTRPAVAAFLIFLVVATAYLLVNVASVIDEQRQLGRPLEHWRPWIWEGTSFLAWILLAPLILWSAQKIERFRGLISRLGLHLIGLLLASAAHTSAIILLRQIAYALAGETYRLSWALGEMAIYELRKDALTYAFLVGAYYVARRMNQPGSPPQAEPDEQLVEVRDGARTSWLRPSEIDWLAAAGNYVELHGAFGTILSRRTLREMEEELAPAGFLRIHRSRLVRRAAIAQVTTRQSGDFDLTLRSGTAMMGSRRYRDALER